MIDILLLIFGFLGLFVFVLCYHSLCYGFISYKCYQWFVLPVVGGPDFTWLNFVGFSFFLFFLVSRGNTGHSPKQMSTEGWMKLILGPWAVLFVIYIFHLFI